MTLFTFARRTSPFAFYAIPLVFGSGVVVSVIDGDPAQGVAVFFAGLALFLAYLLGTALHRQRLILHRLAGYVASAFRNSSEYGHPTPSKSVGLAYFDYVTENPLNE